MLASIAKVLLSAAASAAVAVFKTEIEQGVAVVKGGLDHALHGRGLAPPSADLSRGNMSGSGQLALAGLVVAGVGVLFLPQVRTAVLDFHDGALRKLGARAKRALQGSPVDKRGRDWSLRVTEEPEGDLEPNEHEFDPATAVAPVH